MKDKVFIAWSGSRTVAAEVCRKLMKEDFLCLVGGNDQNEVQAVGIAEAVVAQMKECNQAIVIFQNRDKEGISGNLFFELGYVFAVYGAEKVHCVRRRSDEIRLPSDLDNAFIEPLDDETEEIFVDSIVKYFFKRQKMTVEKNKMELINNRHNIRNLINSHYSKEGSRCSDYELAQYVLFYVQAAHMFRDEQEVLEELRRFNHDHYSRFSRELGLSVKFSIAYLKMTTELLKNDGEGEVYVTYETFDEFDHVCSLIMEPGDEDDVGDFYLWLHTFVYETWNFAYLLIAENPDEREEDRADSLREALRLGEEALRALKRLEQNETVKRVNDLNGIIALFRSYLFRNQFVAMRDLGQLENDPAMEQESVKYLLMAKTIRATMAESYKGTLDSKLYGHLAMENYLASCECLMYAGEQIDSREIRSLKRGIRSFIDSLETERQQSYVYIEQIMKLYDEIKSL